VRILTRYILGEILSSRSSAARSSRSFYSCRNCHILEVVVRNSSTWAMWRSFLFTLPNLFNSRFHGGAVGVMLGLSRLRRQRDYCHARSGWHLVLCARGIDRGGGGHVVGLVNSLYLAPRANQAIIEMEQALETSQASYEIEPRVFYENSKTSFSTCRMCARARARPTGARFSWPTSGSSESSDHDGSLSHRGQRQLAGADHAPARRLARRDRGRRAGQSNISTFTTTDMPLALGPQSDVHLGA